MMLFWFTTFLAGLKGLRGNNLLCLTVSVRTWKSVSRLSVEALSPVTMPASSNRVGSWLPWEAGSGAQAQKERNLAPLHFFPFQTGSKWAEKRAVI